MVDYVTEQRAKSRGERLRTELLARLGDGPQDAAALLPRLEIADVSLSEVCFQLDRLAEEGRAVAEPGDLYRLA